MDNVPSASEVLLEGKLAECASGKARSNGEENTLNASILHADGSNLIKVDPIESGGCEGGATYMRW